MSSSRHRSRKSPTKVNKLTRNNNIQLFKLIDPIIQSVLFIVFLYCLDSQSHFSYRTIMLITIAWQLLSAFVNFIINDPKQLKLQRASYLVVIALFLVVYFYFERNTIETMIPLDQGLKPTIPLKQVILMSIAMIIAFWYNVICYREIRTIMGGVINRGRGN